MKKFIICFTLLTTFLINPVTANATTLYVDNQSMDMELTNVNGVTFVPLRKVSEKAGLDVIYDNETKSINVDNKFTHSIGSNYIVMPDGKPISIGEASFVKNGTTYVSIRLFSIGLGYDIDYDNISKTIWVSTNTDANLPDDYIYEVSSLNEINNRKSNKADEKISTVIPLQSVIDANSNSEINLINTSILKGGDITSDELLKNNSAIILDNSSLNSNKSEINTVGKGTTGIYSTNSNVILKNSNINTSNELSDGIRSDNTTNTINNSRITSLGENSNSFVASNGIVNITNSNLSANGENSSAINESNNELTIKDSNIKSNNYNAIESNGSSIKIDDSIISARDNAIKLDNNGDLNVSNSTIVTNGTVFQLNNGCENVVLKNNEFTSNNKTFFNAVNSDLNIDLTNNSMPKQINLINFLNTSDDLKSLALTLNNQVASGNIVLSENADATINIKNNSSYAGSINHDNTADEIILDVDSSSTVDITGDSYVTVINPTTHMLDNINSKGYNIYYDNKDFRNAWLDDNQYILNGGGKLIPTDSKKVIYLK